MAKKKIKIEWNIEPSLYFNELMEHLYGESENAAYIVGNAILDEIDKLKEFPKANPIDRFKKNNDGNFRAFSIYSYRVTYYIDDFVIYILRIRHTSQEPLDH